MATNNLKTIMTKEGITGTELAQEAKLASATISRISNKRYTPSPTTMRKIVIAINKLSKKNGTQHQYVTTDIFPSFKDNQ